MAGANVTMMTSALLRHGVRYMSKVTEEMIVWMEAHEYESVQQMQGSMSQKSVAEPRRVRACQLHQSTAQFSKDMMIN
jgi:dihydroorotate dehydrogenase (fumarate)